MLCTSRVPAECWSASVAAVRRKGGEPSACHLNAWSQCRRAEAHDAGMDARSLVFDIGDRVTGWGRLVRTPAGAWFNPPLAITTVGYANGRPPPLPSHLAVPIEGADFDAVTDRYERDGHVEGWATVTGEWLDPGIRVEEQSKRAEPHRDVSSWTVPPCPSPPSGWPRGQMHENLDFDPGDLETTGAALTFVLFRPSDDQTVLVVAAGDPATVEARLRPQLGDRLCVVPSRWTKAQLDQAFDYLRARFTQWGIYQAGPRVDEGGQPSIRATLVRVTPEIAQWANDHPPGLLSLEPWLAPSHRS